MEEKILYLKSWFTSKYINAFGDKSFDFKSILIIKLDEIGDLVTALPVFYSLNELYPDAKQTLVCKGFNNSFFDYLDYVECVNDFEEVSENTYDLIVDLRGDEQTRKYALRHKPKLRLDRGGVRLFNKFNGGQKNEIDTNLQIIETLTNKQPSQSNRIVISEKERKTVDEYITHQNADPFVIMHLGARDRSRRWPADRFAAIITYINEKYHMPCILVGGPDDQDVNNECLTQVINKNNYNVVGEFNLLEYAALCEKASLFVGNESGPLHIAAAMNTPTVALFGPGVKDVFYPRNEKSIIHHYFLSRGHKKQTIENSTIFNITVDEVLESVDKQLTSV